MQTSNERRKWKRLEPQILMHVVFRPEFSRVGSISNISRYGLGYRYLWPEDEEVHLAERFQLIDIITLDNSFYFRNIPCSLVYDSRENNDQLTSMLNLVNRFCGLKFDPLTEEQEKQINLFLEKHTTAFARPLE